MQGSPNPFTWLSTYAVIALILILMSEARSEPGPQAAPAAAYSPG